MEYYNVALGPKIISQQFYNKSDSLFFKLHKAHATGTIIIVYDFLINMVC